MTNTSPGWYYDPAQSTLWHRLPNGWVRHGGIPTRLRQKYFHLAGHPDNPITNRNALEKAQIMIHGDRIALQGSSPVLPPARETGDELQWCRQSLFAQEWKLELTQTGALTSLRLDLRNGHGYAVSDGSYKSGNGAAAWIIEGKTAANRLTGVCYTPGCADDHSSFHSELAGLLGLLHVLAFWKPTTGKPTCHIECDGQSVIN